MKLKGEARAKGEKMRAEKEVLLHQQWQQNSSMLRSLLFFLMTFALCCKFLICSRCCLSIFITIALALLFKHHVSPKGMHFISLSFSLSLSLFLSSSSSPYLFVTCHWRPPSQYMMLEKLLQTKICVCPNSVMQSFLACASLSVTTLSVATFC